MRCHFLSMVVAVQAEGSNMIPTRQHPELGQDTALECISIRCNGQTPPMREAPSRKHSDLESISLPLRTGSRISLFGTSLVFICFQLHDASNVFSDSIAVRPFLKYFAFLVKKEEPGWKQSSLCCAEKHIIVATHMSQVSNISTDTDVALLYTRSLPLHGLSQESSRAGCSTT